MAITPVNKTKHSITPNSGRKSGYAFWDDSQYSWNSSDIFWNSPLVSMVNKTKHSITPVNQAKS